MVSIFNVGLRKTVCCLCEFPCRRKSHSNSNLWHHSTMRLDVFWWWCVEDIFLTCQIFFLPLSSWEEEEKANAIWTNKDYIGSTRRTDDLSRVDRKQKITSSFFWWSSRQCQSLPGFHLDILKATHSYPRSEAWVSVHKPQLHSITSIQCLPTTSGNLWTMTTRARTKATTIYY